MYSVLKLFSRGIFVIITLFVNANFVYPQSITVKSPNGGEIWDYNNKYNIQWDYTGISNLNIEFSINGGLNWNTIQVGIPASNQSYSWRVPNLPTGQALVRIYSGNISDESNNYFFIKSPQFNPGAKIKILPIGNSITSDHTRNEFRFAQNKISYRYFLWDLLRTNNYDIDFIGHKYGGYNYFPEPENSGTPGINTMQEFQLLQTGIDPKTNVPVTSGFYLNTYKPDIILLHLGTNDAVYSTNTAYIVNILNLIKNFDPNIWIVLALIINSSPPDDSVTVFNKKLENEARYRIDNGDKIIIVDMQNDAGLDYNPPGDFIDVVHLNNTGKEKMANLWFKYLKLILPVPVPESPNIPTISDDTAFVGLPYKYDVDASGVGAPNYSIITSPPTPEITINSKTGVINWRPDSVGTVNIKITASNSIGNISRDFNIKILPKPPLTNNIISYWKLNESRSQTVFEDLVGTNDSKCTDCPSPFPGIVDGALNFSNNIVAALDDSSLYFYPSESFTLETWVKTNNIGEQAFIGKFGGFTSYFLGTSSSSQTKFEIQDSTGSIVSVLGPAINDGNWHHIVGIVDRSKNRLSIYIDGIRTSISKTFHPSGFFSYEPLTFGYYKNSNFYNGLLDEIAIYNIALSDSEIVEHYNKGKFYGVGYFEPLQIQFGVFIDEDNLIVKVKPSPNYKTTDQLIKMTFTIRWLNFSRINLGSVISNYHIEKIGSESIKDNYEYQKFAFTGPPLPLPENWNRGKEYEVLRVPILNSESSYSALELMPFGFLSNGMGDPFVEINLPPDETNKLEPYYHPSVNNTTTEILSSNTIIENNKVYQNHPNPFNPSTTIKYTIGNDRKGAERQFVSLKVFDLLGREVVTLVNEEQSAGEYEVEFSAKGASSSSGDAYDLSSGVYIYALRILPQSNREKEFIQTKKMIFIK